MERSGVTNDQRLLVKKIAEPMRDPDWVKGVALSPSNVNPDPYSYVATWSDLSLIAGYPGVLLLLSELDSLFPNEQWDLAAHSYILKIKEAVETSDITYFPLYGGLAGVCFSIMQASRDGTRYQNLLSTLNDYLIEKITSNYLLPLQRNLDKSQPSNPALYDLIQGVVGVGMYGLLNLHQDSFRSLCEQIALFCIGFSKPLTIEGFSVPGWYHPVQYQFLEQDKKLYPKGNFNLGLAHGVPGVLSFLSIALLHGVNMPGQEEAIQRISEWLYEHRTVKDGQVCWQARISFEELTSGSRKELSHFPRDAWCYGTPGVARSLFLAGKALNDKALKTKATSSFLSIFDRSRSQWQLPGPTLCHGISGLLIITQLMAQDSQASELIEKVDFLEDLLWSYYNPEFPFGFKDLEPSKNGNYVGIDRAGFLEGASGVLLALLNNSQSRWHAPLLISDEI